LAQDALKMIDQLNDLIALDRDAVEAYESAIERMTVPELRQALVTFQADHRRHIADLSAVVTRFRGEPRATTDVKGFFIKGFTAISSIMGDGSALRAMRGNEKLTTRAYQKALEKPWPSDVRVLIERNRADEERHLAFIEEAIRLREWESDSTRSTQP
jgi:uncharacterized protein (TIGR02284 family)